MLQFPCRFCGTPLEHRVVDLGMSPLCESYIPPERLDAMEPFYPLNVWVCSNCLLVQLNEYVTPKEIFTEYAYFSSYSTSWLRHASDYTAMIVKRLGLDSDSFVVELASNDGYLLQNFVQRGIPCLGIEPAANVAEAAASARRPDRRCAFFDEAQGRRLADERTPGRSRDRQQRARPCPRPEQLRRRHQPPAEAVWHGDDGVPAPDAAVRREPVRHHLPRALLLLLAARRRGRLRGATA